MLLWKVVYAIRLRMISAYIYAHPHYFEYEYKFGSWKKRICRIKCIWIKLTVMSVSATVVAFGCRFPPLRRLLWCFLQGSTILWMKTLLRLAGWVAIASRRRVLLGGPLGSILYLGVVCFYDFCAQGLAGWFQHQVSKQMRDMIVYWCCINTTQCWKMDEEEDWSLVF